MKKFLNVLCNIFWIILIGIESWICNVVVGIVLCCTIIGIPFGLRYLKFTKLVFAPFGKKVEIHFGKHGFLNVLWLIFGGLEAFLVYGFVGCICCVTIIGIPLGKQVFKIAKYFLAPFGAEILSGDTNNKIEKKSETPKLESAKTQNTKTIEQTPAQTKVALLDAPKTYAMADFSNLAEKVKANPDKLMADGTSVKEYISTKQTTLQRENAINKLSSSSKLLLFLGVFIGLIIIVAVMVLSFLHGFTSGLVNVDLSSLNLPEFVEKIIVKYAESPLAETPYLLYYLIAGELVGAFIFVFFLIRGIIRIKNAKKQKLELYNSNYGELVELYNGAEEQPVKKAKTLTQKLMYAVE